MTAVTNYVGKTIPSVQHYRHFSAMRSAKSHRLIEVLKATLRQVETSTEWSQEDPAVVELKHILQRRIDQELGPQADLD